MVILAWDLLFHSPGEGVGFNTFIVISTGNQFISLASGPGLGTGCRLLSLTGALGLVRSKSLLSWRQTVLAFLD